MTDLLHLKVVNDKSTKVATRDEIDDELNKLSLLIAKHLRRADRADNHYWSAAYQALRWARDPQGHFPPSEMKGFA